MKKSFTYYFYRILFGLIGYWIGYQVVKTLLKVTNKDELAYNDSGWTPKYEKSIHDTIYNAFGKILTDEKQRSEVAGCWILKMKTKYPKGLETVPKDSIKIISAEVAENCTLKVKDISAIIPWTPQGEQVLRNSFLNGDMQKVEFHMRNRMCDCIIKNLKAAYPNGVVSPLSDSIKTSITSKCVQVELNNKINSK